MSGSAGTATESRTQEQRRAEAERRLVDAAADLISEAGPASVTLAKVGQRAGYSSGLAGHYFGSKAELMRRVADDVSEDFRAALRAGWSADGTLLDDVRALVDVYFDIVIDPPALNRARLVLIADAIAHPHADTRAVVVEADAAFRSAVADRIRSKGRGDVPIDAEAFAVVLIGLLRGVTFESMLDDAVDLEAARAEVVRLVSLRLGTVDGAV